jgi:pimeloyl-ACP methyl ester carboxylesterase
MHLISLVLLCVFARLVENISETSNTVSPWLRLPPTPRLMFPWMGQHVKIHGIHVWFNIYGSLSHPPVLFLHGGFANSDYWGLQVRELHTSYRCILMDSRGQGRSTSSSANITYELMTSDVVALLDYLGIQRVHVVGWSDGAIIGLNLAMKYPTRLRSLFAFAANYVPSGVKDVTTSPVFMEYLTRSEIEYDKINPAKNYQNLYNNLTTMWTTQPNWTRTDFAKIKPDLPVWIVDGDHEEGIYREQPDTMTSWIRQAGELILPRTSHFAFLQDADDFTLNLKRFLAQSS